MDALPHGGHPDGRRLGRVPGRVGQQVAQDLDDALPVRQHPRQVRWQVDAERIPAPSAQVHVSGLIHDGRKLHGLGCDRQPARLDVRRVQQVADQLPHVIRLLVDDPEELHRLGRIQRPRRAQHRGRGALDRGQRGTELVAYHAQKLGSEPLQLLQRRQVLQGDDQRLDLALLRADGRGVDEYGDPPAVRNLQDDLLGAHRGGVAQHMRQGRLFERHLVTVRAPHPQHLQQIFRRLASLPLPR